MNNIAVGSQAVTVQHPSVYGKSALLDRLSPRQKVRRPRTFSLFVADRPGLRPYTLVFEDDELPRTASCVQSVRVTSTEEVQRYRFFLGNSCELYLSPAFAQKHPEISCAMQLQESRASGGMPPDDMEEAALLLRKLPMNLREALRSPLAVMEGDRYPAAIDCRYIHKRHSGNALISQLECKFYLLYLFV